MSSDLLSVDNPCPQARVIASSVCIVEQSSASEPLAKEQQDILASWFISNLKDPKKNERIILTKNSSSISRRWNGQEEQAGQSVEEGDRRHEDAEVADFVGDDSGDGRADDVDDGHGAVHPSRVLDGKPEVPAQREPQIVIPFAL